MALRPGRDRFLVLACDGLWDVMESEEVLEVVSRRLDADEEADDDAIAQELVKMALERATTDNVSVLLVRFHWRSCP